MTRATLDTPLAGVVGARTAKPLERAFEMRTVGDLLHHFPRRYSRRGELTPLKGLPTGEQITVVAQVLDVRQRQMQRRRGHIIEARITDGTGILTLTFFNQKYRVGDLVPGRRGIFAGKVSEYHGNLQLQHPEYELFENRDDAPGADRLDEAAAKAWSETPVPIYPATAQVASWTLQRAIALALDALDPVPDPVPAEILRREGVMEYGRALELIHRPQHDADWRGAQQSLRFREAFELQLALLDRRRRAGLAASTPRPLAADGVNADGMNADGVHGRGLLARFDAELPFELTGDQRRAGVTISAELSVAHPMHRLLQGEVGSGKTIVALRAMLQVAEPQGRASDSTQSPDTQSPGTQKPSTPSPGGQSAMLAPTEVLAAQHFRSIVRALGPDLTAELHPVLLTGRMPAAERKRALLALAAGTSHIAVGTHALLSEGVTFADLGLVIVDEQHRFGVEQRDTLRSKGAQPHVLAMTATPIPRTVALTAFGDLEVSTIRELPPGRQGIETFAVPEIEMPARAARVWARAREDLAAGRQVYVVCPAISSGEPDPELPDEEPPQVSAVSEGETARRPLANVADTIAELRARPEFAGIVIEGLHGAMPSDEKERVMQAFAAGSIGVLVATTVIEVGVDVPNASIMIVRDADRFGISQLHQLRGRVGRGEHPGLCLLMTTAEQGSVARERIDAVADTSDGFELAEVDLQLRREGDILGTAQSGGRSTLRLLRVAEHGELIAHARDVAAALLERDPELSTAPGLAALLTRERQAGHLDNLAKS
ncbi:MAG: ATP-dependent DNA helicase RecG [Leucobacter sp.]